MSEGIRVRPKPGELVRIGDLPGTFRVLDCDGATFLLESQHGARCRAGVRVTRLADQQQRERAA